LLLLVPLLFALNDRVLPIIINTALAGTSGGLLAMFVSWKILGKPVVDRIINGVIAGLVSITASVHLTPPLTAIFIGAVGGIVCVFGMMVLERWKIDDAIGAVPAHLFAGMGHLGCRAHPCGPLGDRWGTGLTR
ncbi:MAG: ammonium transporter, partial [Magnetovibrio sp.]|nr:ammonium transporter [Magnetovibrio sp.]